MSNENLSTKPTVATESSNPIILTPSLLDTVVKDFNKSPPPMRQVATAVGQGRRISPVSLIPTTATPTQAVRESLQRFSYTHILNTPPVVNTPPTANKRKALNDPAVSPEYINEEKRQHIDTSSTPNQSSDTAETDESFVMPSPTPSVIEIANAAINNSIENVTNDAPTRPASPTPSLVALADDYQERMPSPLGLTQALEEINELNQQSNQPAPTPLTAATDDETDPLEPSAPPSPIAQTSTTDNNETPLQPSAPPIELMDVDEEVEREHPLYKSVPEIDWTAVQSATAVDAPAITPLDAAESVESSWPEEAQEMIRNLRKQIEALQRQLSCEKEEIHNKIKLKVTNTVASSKLTSQSTSSIDSSSAPAAQSASVQSTGITDINNTAPKVVAAAAAQPASVQSTDINTAPKVVAVGTSMTRGIDTACEIAGEPMDLHIFPGATLQYLAIKVRDIFKPAYQPETILLHCGTINCLRFFGPQVVDAYKYLISVIRELCPRAKIVVSKISYANYYGKNMIRDHAHRFTPGDRQRVDIVNLSMRVWSRQQNNNVETIDFLPPDDQKFFSRDGLHFNDVGRSIYLQKVAAFVAAENFRLGH